MKSQHKRKVREFNKIAAKNRATAKRVAALRQKMILGFAEPATREGTHSSLVIAPQRVVDPRSRKRSASRVPMKGNPDTNRLSSFRYQFGEMNARFQKSARYMEQVVKAKRQHMGEFAKLVGESRAIKRIDNQIAKYRTLGDMAKVESLEKARKKALHKIQLQAAKTKQAKAKVVAASEGMGELWDSFTGAISDIGVNLGDILKQGVTGVVQAKTAAEVAQEELKAKQKLLEMQLEAQRKMAETQAQIAAASQPTTLQTVATVAQQSLEKPWYQNPMVLLPVAGGLTYLLLKK